MKKNIKKLTKAVLLILVVLSIGINVNFIWNGSLLTFQFGQTSFANGTGQIMYCGPYTANWDNMQIVKPIPTGYVPLSYNNSTAYAYIINPITGQIMTYGPSKSNWENVFCAKPIPAGYVPLSFNPSIAYAYIINNNAPPTVSITTPAANAYFNSTLIPSISVSDVDNDTLTCKYFIDSETTPRDTKTVSNTTTAQTMSFMSFDAGQLTEGQHQIKFDISDGIRTISQVRSFNVLKTGPVINPLTITKTESSISVTGSASNNILNLDSQPYRITIGNNTPTSWLAPSNGLISYTQTGLIPNTQYAVKFEAKDSIGNISQKIENAYTLAQVPVLSANNITNTAFDLATSDNNSSGTQYQITLGSKYVNQTGSLSTTPAWVTLTNKKITITGLTTQTSYSFSAIAKNNDGISSASSNTLTVSTIDAPSIPVNLKGTETNNSVILSWDSVKYATKYEVMIDGNVYATATTTAYEHSGLNIGTPHTYKIRAINVVGTSAWSTSITKTPKSYLKSSNYSLTNSINKPVNFALKASKVKSFSNHYFVVSFNSNDLDIVDLCAKTATKEVIQGNISGTDIQVINLVPGKIVFTFSKNVKLGTTWTGALNTIKFKAKQSNSTAISYQMY